MAPVLRLPLLPLFLDLLYRIPSLGASNYRVLVRHSPITFAR